MTHIEISENGWDVTELADGRLSIGYENGIPTRALIEPANADWREATSILHDKLPAGTWIAWQPMSDEDCVFALF